MNNNNTPKVHVVLKKPHAITGIISLAQAIEAAMAANATTFPSPTPTMVQYASDIQSLVAAQSTAYTRLKGAVQTRNAMLAVVVMDLNQLRAYVEAVANANPATAAAIVNSACMVVRKPLVRTKNAVNVKLGSSSGSVIATAWVGANKTQSHEWQYSADGGKTWVDIAPTMQAKTTITGLVPASTVLVRTRALSKTGLGAWTDPVSLLVH